MRVGLLGTGPWAERVHGPALQAHPEVDLVGVWGRRPGAAAALAQACGTRPYEDVDRLLAAVDAVAVALPPDVQAELGVRAAEAGCHLLLDKPVATDVERARLLAGAADRAGVASVVFLTLRFDPVVEEWIAARAAEGGWFTGRADWLGAVFAEGADSPFANSPWRRERGGLWDVGPHALSLLLAVLGDVPDLTSVTAARGPGDTVHVLLRHAGGASTASTLSLTAPPAAAGAGVELRGAHGTVTLPEGSVGPVVAFQRAVDALLTAVRTGTPHACDVRFGLRITEILDAAERSLS